MLFQNIQALIAKGVALQFIVRSAGDKLAVTVLPEAGSESKVTGLVAQTFTATAAELDSEFAGIMGAYSKTNSTLHDQLAAFQKQADEMVAAATIEAAEKAKVKANAKPTKGAKPTPTLLTDHPGEVDGSVDENDAASGGGLLTESSDMAGVSSEPQAFSL